MNLSELKQKPIQELMQLADELQIENVSRSRRQEVVFQILKALAKKDDVAIDVEGVLELMPDGFGFLRGADASYLAGPDDVYLSPAQIRRFNLRTGDFVRGKVRAPKEGERYFSLQKVDDVNGDNP
jgi:transcription termination factor Rho